jgi:thioredoxin 1
LHRSIDSNRAVRDRIKYSNVIKLDSETFNKTIHENDIVFVEFYLPTCGHCVKFVPDYDRVGAHFKNAGLKVVVAAVDSNDEEELALAHDVHSYPTFKVFIRGEALKYAGERKAESMIAFNTDLANALLLISPQTTNIPKPFVAVSGIDARSPFHALPALFSTHPVYHITGRAQFSIEFHTEEDVKTYRGSPSLEDVVQWLDHVSSPVLVSMGESVPSKKLEKAIANQVPILVVLNKHERSAAAPALEFLGSYCQDITRFICGYVHSDEPDYQELLEWTGDKDTHANRLYWIKTETLNKYLFPGNPNELTKESLDAFIRAV